MTEPRTWYVVQAVQPWSALQLSVGMGGAQSPAYVMQASDDPEEPIGFLAVFDNLERAEAYAGDVPVAQIIARQAAES